MMAANVAKRLVEHLERSGFVVMKKPPIGGGAAIGRGQTADDAAMATQRAPLAGMADAGALMRDHGAEAYAEARRREREVSRTKRAQRAASEHGRGAKRRAPRRNAGTTVR